MGAVLRIGTRVVTKETDGTKIVKEVSTFKGVCEAIFASTTGSLVAKELVFASYSFETKTLLLD